ncbi:MAG: DinB family protein [Candidatus Rokuibacteriota bacterium]
MPFAYYARLTRRQRAIYDKSDAITEIRLARPEALRPSVDALASALDAEDRMATQQATHALIRGLCEAMGLPPVRVEVLAARPHARWGELHGLYTNERGRPPKIQLWMRTAKQKRVVAFRTYLRTLLHEVGHHTDYTVLRLADSYHTEGFYKRESSLFHQLVPGSPERRGTMPTLEEYAKLPVADRLERMTRTADELAAAVKGRDDAALSRRPDPKNFAAKECVCHLRDIEELFLSRFQLMTAVDDPKLFFDPATPDRWAEERQYLRHDAQQAVAAFRRRREETLAFLNGLAPEQWRRGGMHATRGRVTVDDFVTLMAWHDDNHLDQLARALEGRA